MWHGMNSGEPDNNIEVVFSDIIDWLDKQCGNDIAVYTRPVQQSDPAIENFMPVTLPAARKPRQARSAGSYLCATTPPCSLCPIDSGFFF